MRLKAIATALLVSFPAHAADLRMSDIPVAGSLAGTETFPILLPDNLTLKRATIAQLTAAAAWNQWKGAWSGATTYVINDMVSSSGSTYIAIAPSLNHAPPNATYWNLVAQAGAGIGTVTSIVAGTGLTGGTITGSGTIALSAPVSIANGGTNATSASGTALDNITGFASTGFLKRTGTGTYTFLADPLPFANGGTGISSGTSGGVPCFTGSTTLASSAALGQYYLVTGGGAGVCPGQVASLGTTTTVLHGNASGLPTFAAVAYADIATAAIATSANVLANAASTIATPNAIWGAGAVTALTDAATIGVDMSTGINFSVTLGGSRTLGNPTNTKVGQSGAIRVSQDGTGSRTLAYGGNYKWASGTACVLSTAASKIDYLFYFVYSSTEIFLSCTLDVR